MSMNPPRLLAAMAAHLPRHLLVLLFAFLAVHVPSSTHGNPLPSTYDVSMCSSESFWCGGVEIHYPFYLANATEATADYSGNFSCGYTDLNISCTLLGQNLTPTIRLGRSNDEYTVKNISYNDGTILLVDSDVLLEGSDCPAVRHDVSFDKTWLRSASYNGNLTFFFGCDPPGPVPPRFDAYKINFTQFKSPPGAGQGDSFMVMTDDRYLEQQLATICGDSMVVTVPVTGDVLMEASYNNFTSGGYGDVLKRGFELEWSHLTADGCQQCEASKGQCAYSQNRGYMGCLCDGGKVGNPYCKQSSKGPFGSQGGHGIFIGYESFQRNAILHFGCQQKQRKLFRGIQSYSFFRRNSVGKIPRGQTSWKESWRERSPHLRPRALVRALRPVPSTKKMRPRKS